MTCTLVNRERVLRAERLMPDHVPVESMDVVRPAKSPYNAWTFEAVLSGVDGVPPEVLRVLAKAGLTLQKTPSQGEYEHVAATV